MHPFDYLENAGTEHADVDAIVTPYQAISYGNMLTFARRIAWDLRQRGVASDDIVAIRLPEIADFITTFAVFHEAAIASPYFDEFAEVPNLTAKWVYTHQFLKDVPADRQIVVSEEWYRQLPDPDSDFAPRAYESNSSVCGLLFTSGTSGRPKAIGGAVSVWCQDVDLSFQPMLLGPGRIGPGLWYRFLRVRVGGTYGIIGNKISETIPILEKLRPTTLAGSPRQLAQLLDWCESSGYTLPSVTSILLMGSQTPSAVLKRLRNLNPSIIANFVYGSNEAGAIAFRPAASEDVHYVGQIIPGAQAQIVDDEGNVCDDGVIGTIRVRGEARYMKDGYYKDPENTALYFRDGWFYPGDLGWLEGNKLFFAGRTSEIINAGGVKIDPNTVDNVVLGIPGIVACATFAFRGNSDLDVVACAYVSEQELDTDELSRLTSEKIGSATPEKWFRVDSIPMGQTGKPLRRELTAQFSRTT